MSTRTAHSLREAARHLIPRRLRVVLWRLMRANKRLWRLVQLTTLRTLDLVASNSPAVLRPWLGDRRDRFKVAIRPRLVPERRLQRSFREALAMLKERKDGMPLGDYLEFGVFNGTSMVCMYRALQELDLAGVRSFGFDSFAGLPQDATDPDEGGLWHPGQFAASCEFATMVLRHSGVDPGRVRLIPGWFDETLTNDTAESLGLETVSVVMIDCDLYASTRTALQFAAPFISGVAIFVFDDWHSGQLSRRGLGERRAFEEFLDEHPEFSATPLRELRYTRHAEVFLVEQRHSR